MVSMMQALQSGASLTICPGHITWTTPDRTTLGFTNRQQGELHNIGTLTDIGLVQGMAMDEHLEILFVMTEDLLDATKQNTRVATGRRSTCRVTVRDPGISHDNAMTFRASTT